MTGWKPIPLQSSHDLDSNRYSQGNDEPRKEKGGNLMARKKLQRRLFALLLLVLPSSTGCVTIRKTPQKNVSSVTNCGMNIAPDSGEYCELYDRGAVMKRWASQLNPLKLVPSRVTEFVSQQPGRCAAAKASVQGWIHAKKADANPAPWPRFHPVPTKPVFEADEAESSGMPEIYGRFGKG